MRVVRELSKEDIKITIFNWNSKYLLKFEQGMIEQTYKVSEFDVISDEDLDAVIQDPDFWEGVKKRFDQMHQDLRNVMIKI